MHSRFFEATSLLIGTIVGAGILGIPFVVAKVGLAIGSAYIIGVGLLFLVLNLMMGETVARTKKPMQIVGLSSQYIGAWGKRLSVLVLFLNAYGALLAYTIGEGLVLAALFGGSPVFWSYLFFVFGAIVLATRIRWIASIEFAFTALIFVIVMVIASVGAPHITMANTATVNWAELFLPFGVMLFAYGGATAIPQMEELLPNNRRALKRAVILGSVIPILLYLIFAVVVVGVTGNATTEVATVGLGAVVGPWMVALGNVFAFFTMATSFIMLGFILKRSFQWDYGISRTGAWIATLIPPLVVFALGARSFIGVLNIAGALFGGMMTILIVLTFWRAKRMGTVKQRIFNLHHGLLLGVLLIIIFTVGSIYSFVRLLGV